MRLGLHWSGVLTPVCQVTDKVALRLQVAYRRDRFALCLCVHVCVCVPYFFHLLPGAWRQGAQGQSLLPPPHHTTESLRFRSHVGLKNLNRSNSPVWEGSQGWQASHASSILFPLQSENA